MVDNIEEKSQKIFNCNCGHMDPLDTRDPLTAELNVRLGEAISDPRYAEIHDLRVVVDTANTRSFSM